MIIVDLPLSCRADLEALVARRHVPYTDALVFIINNLLIDSEVRAGTELQLNIPPSPLRPFGNTVTTTAGAFCMDEVLKNEILSILT